MPLIQIETKIVAPQERVFDLARSIDAHMASTRGTHEKAVAGRTSGLGLVYIAYFQLNRLTFSNLPGSFLPSFL